MTGLRLVAEVDCRSKGRTIAWLHALPLLGGKSLLHSRWKLRLRRESLREDGGYSGRALS